MFTVGKVYELVGVRNDDTGVTLFGVKGGSYLFIDAPGWDPIVPTTSRNSVIYSSPRSKNDQISVRIRPYASSVGSRQYS